MNWVLVFSLLGGGATFASEVMKKTQEQTQSDSLSQEPAPQLERGRPNILLDSAGNIMSLPEKLILLNPRMGSHHISPATEKVVREFLRDHPDLKDLKVRLNQGAFFGDLKRLMHNDKIEWYWRIFPGIPVTMFASLTGRLMGGDHYNAFTNTIHLYSDDPAVALHELGHAKDFAESSSPGYYAVGRMIPGVDLYQEYAATDHAINYLRQKGSQDQELKAYNTLYPAYGTYLGSYSGLAYGNVLGAGVGHLVGGWQRHERKLGYQVMRQARQVGEVILELDSLGKNLLENDAKTSELFHRALANQD